MAQQDMVWRKLPIGIIRDEDMDLIADQLPPEMKAAPYMFYFTALCKADNDGIFDLEDGVIFSRLMRIGTPKDVFIIANLMMKRKLIMRYGETSRCMITAWDYPQREKPRTIEERRKVVQQQIETEKKAEPNGQFSFQPIAQQQVNNEFSDFGEPVDRNFFSHLNDKKAENVTKNFFDDKNEKNVVKKIETEREKERERERLRVERIETHTEREEEERETEKLALAAIEAAYSASTEEYTTEHTENTEIHNEQTEQENNAMRILNQLEENNLVDHAENDEVRTQVYGSLVSFFTKNNLAFNEQRDKEELIRIVDRVIPLATARNPAPIVINVMLAQFKKLSEEDAFYKGTPLTPYELLKPGMYGHVLQAASKILLNQSNKDGAWLDQMKQYEAEVAKEKSAIYNVMDQEYIQYGIDPADPNRAAKLLQIKAGSKQETEPP